MYVEGGGYVGGGVLRWGGGVRWWGCLLDVGYVEGVRWGGGGGKLGPGGVWDLDPGRPLKNRSKITARNERFFKQDLSGLSDFSKKTAQTAQTTQIAQILLENRSNRSNLERFLSGISTRVVARFLFPPLFWRNRLAIIEFSFHVRLHCLPTQSFRYSSQSFFIVPSFLIFQNQLERKGFKMTRVDHPAKNAPS